MDTEIIIFFNSVYKSSEIIYMKSMTNWKMIIINILFDLCKRSEQELEVSYVLIWIYMNM